MMNIYMKIAVDNVRYLGSVKQKNQKQMEARINKFDPEMDNLFLRVNLQKRLMMLM